jgi:glucose-1-phosphate adenylyltransferase
MVINMIALILGGGAGTRLYPLTSQRSKPAVPIGGKYRLIDIPISNCLNSGVRRMFVLTQFNSASLNQHIKNTFAFDHFSEAFVDILAAEQTPTSDKWFQGTADAVRQSMHHLNNHKHDYILILSGDQLYQMNFEELALFHVNKDADVTIATIPVEAEQASAFGILKTDEDSWIRSFTEKPKQDILADWSSPVPEKYSRQNKIYLASMGIYIFKKEALMKLFKDHPDAVDFGKEILPQAIRESLKVASFPYGGYWEDIGTVRSFYEANIAMADDIPEFNLFDNENVIYTRPRLLAPSKVFGTRFNRSVVAEGCIIMADEISDTIVGIRSRIGKGTTINRAVVFGHDYYETLDEIQNPHGGVPMGIGENCYIEQAIIEKNTRIGHNVVICGSDDLEDVETDLYVIRSGVIVLKKGVIVPSDTTIGKPVTVA